MGKIRIWLSYLKYLARHKYYVASACFSLGLYWRGIIHDLSKFRPSEFFPYADYFFGRWRGDPTYEPKPPASTSIAYDMSWNLHKHRNRHHWQYWVTVNDKKEFAAIPMPRKVVEEMVCDWWGAGKAQNNPHSTREWYELHKDKLVLHEVTKRRIQDALYKLEVLHA